jgi:hypothetical protein
LIVANLCPAKFLNKLIGKKEMEDALKRLDKLTQDEARMAAAEILRLTHIVMNGMSSKLATETLILNARALFRWKRNEASGPTTGQQHGRREMFVITPVVSKTGVPNVLVGNQVRESLRTWVPSPDPSTNHSIACGIQHDGSAKWFFRGGIFSEWKSTGSLLWIYGKRMVFPVDPRLGADHHLHS